MLHELYSIERQYSMDDVLNINLDDLTIGEVEELEDLMDAPLDELFGPGIKKGRMMRALVYISNKRDNPDFTWEEAGNFKISVVSSDEATNLDDADES